MVRLSWPFFAAQVVIVCSGLFDVIIAGNYGTLELAAISIGAAFWGTSFSFFFGAIQGVAPIIGKNFGALRFSEIGVCFRAALIVGSLLGCFGSVLMATSARRIFIYSGVPIQLLELTVDYVSLVAWSLPAALIARCFLSLSASVKRPKPIFYINLCALAIKAPLSYTLMYGALGMPELGLKGCAVGTIAMFMFMGCAGLITASRSNEYRKFFIARALGYAELRQCHRILVLGLPIGMASVLEVGSLTGMAFIVVSLGSTYVAAQQIMVSIVGLMFLIPFSISFATQTLVSNAIGRGSIGDARDVAASSVWLSSFFGAAGSALLYFSQTSLFSIYTSDFETKQAIESVLVVYMPYIFFDAIQIVAAGALRGCEKTLLPSIVYFISLWGVGLFGGYVFTHGISLNTELIPDISGRGLMGVWLTGALSLAICAFSFIFILNLWPNPRRHSFLVNWDLKLNEN